MYIDRHIHQGLDRFRECQRAIKVRLFILSETASGNLRHFSALDAGQIVSRGTNIPEIYAGKSKNFGPSQGHPCFFCRPPILLWRHRNSIGPPRAWDRCCRKRTSSGYVPRSQSCRRTSWHMQPPTQPARRKRLCLIGESIQPCNHAALLAYEEM